MNRTFVWYIYAFCYFIETVLHKASTILLGLNRQTRLQPLKVTDCIKKKNSQKLFSYPLIKISLIFSLNLFFDDDDVSIILALNGL